MYRCAEYKVQKIRETPIPKSERAFDNPERVYEFWQANIATAPWLDPEKECVHVIMLNRRNHITGFTLVSIGNLDTSLIHVREVFRPAIIAGAASIVLTHNHPSGDPSPSESDIKMTRMLIQAGRILMLELIDHLVIGQPAPGRVRPYCSLRELGYFYS